MLQIVNKIIFYTEWLQLLLTSTGYWLILCLKVKSNDKPLDVNTDLEKYLFYFIIFCFIQWPVSTIIWFIIKFLIIIPWKTCKILFIIFILFYTINYIYNYIYPYHKITFQTKFVSEVINSSDWRLGLDLWLCFYFFNMEFVNSVFCEYVMFLP